MSHVLLIQIDGKLPNIALMRIASHHRALGDSVELVKGYGYRERSLLSKSPDLVYASIIFTVHADRADDIRRYYPKAVIGGTGTGDWTKLEDIGITTKAQDYSLYPGYTASIGFTQRGCRLACKFCVVPRKEGKVQEEQSVWELWRGDPFPRHLHLLDNDFFGQSAWEKRINEMREGKFAVSFNQGINVRFITDETAAAIASVNYRDDGMKVRRIYTAWDNRKDEDRLFKGLDLLKKHGVAPSSVMVYMLIGYWPGETHEDRDHRRRLLREWGAKPYPMPYERTPELVGFQRWVLTRYDESTTWDQWKRARYDRVHLEWPDEMSTKQRSLFA